jgi:hypothetical protein
MSYFVSPIAEYRAKRIAQILASGGETNVCAQRDGRVMANFGGHIHLLTLDDGQIKILDHVDIIRPTVKDEVVIR